jgi:heme/copper-type cytochrome/quinol oxidase subunit 3
VVTVDEGRPLAVVHMPRRSIAPFAMAVGLVSLFAGLIVDYVPVVLGAAGLITVALIGWFWPQSTETAAMEEVGTPGADELPLAQAGPTANGFWGTWVFILVLATALTTIGASYFYLGGNVRSGGETVPATPLLRPVLATTLLPAGVVAVIAAIRGITRARPGLLRLGVLVALALAAVHLWLLLDALLGSGLSPGSSGPDSGFVAIGGFHAIVVFVLLVMLTIGSVWAVLRPRDARGHGVVWNAGLVYCFAAASGIISLAALYLVPRVG